MKNITTTTLTKRFVSYLLMPFAMLFTLNSKAQEWFPIGATWYYNQVEFLVGESYVYFEVTGETREMIFL